MNSYTKLFPFFTIFFISFLFWMVFTYFVLDWEIGLPTISMSIFSGIVFGLIFIVQPNKGKKDEF